MKKIYIAPELEINEGLLADSYMLSGSDGEGNQVVGGGDDVTPGDGEVWGDSKKRDDFNSLW